MLQKCQHCLPSFDEISPVDNHGLRQHLLFSSVVLLIPRCYRHSRSVVKLITVCHCHPLGVLAGRWAVSVEVLVHVVASAGVLVAESGVGTSKQVIGYEVGDILTVVGCEAERRLRFGVFKDCCFLQEWWAYVVLGFLSGLAILLSENSRTCFRVWCIMYINIRNIKNLSLQPIF